MSRQMRQTHCHWLQLVGIYNSYGVSEYDLLYAKVSPYYEARHKVVEHLSSPHSEGAVRHFLMKF